MLLKMPDHMPAPSANETDGKLPPLDWQAAAPALDLRWYIAAALLMPMLLAAGVYWIRTSPIVQASNPSASTIDVRLVSLPDRTEVKPATAQLGISEAPRSDVLVDDPKRAIPDALVASREPDSEPAGQPASISAPVSLPTSASVEKTSQTAAIFQRALLRHIAKYRNYPDQARRDRVQGSVQLVFAMRRNGTVTDIWVKTGSGHVALDHAAVDTILKAQPLPSIPAGLPDRLNIAMPVDFSLP